MSTSEIMRKEAAISLNSGLCEKIVKLGGDSEMRIFILLLAGVCVFLRQFNYRQPVIIGIPPHKQQRESRDHPALLEICCHVDGQMPFKDLVLQIGNTVFQVYRGDLSSDGTAVGVDAVVLLESIHGNFSFEAELPGVVFSFALEKGKITGILSYDNYVFGEAPASRIVGYYQQLMEIALNDAELPISSIDMIPQQEREIYLQDWNENDCDYPDASLHQLFAQQVEQGPDRMALVFEEHCVTYGFLDRMADQLARQLLRNGAGRDVLVGLLLDPSPGMIAAILGVLKAGAAYVPVDPEMPLERMRYVLKDSDCRLLITSISSSSGISFTRLMGLQRSDVGVIVTPSRSQILELDSLPVPDRRLVEYDKYHSHIGLSMFKNTIAIQATRGCPYNCAYCHKIWPKTHMVRSHNHISDEISRYYELGVRRFMFVDDIFNLNKENSTQFFKGVIKKGWDIQLFFPAGLRGDILTPDYIDLMVEAGTVNLGLALETASPRLQRKIRKNLNLDRFRENITYLCRKYPDVILELFIMHGFPGETEEEALETLEFVKTLQWVHFPYLHILKIYPHTDMETLAFENGITAEAIERSAGLAYHELPETLPFDKSFTRACQADFLNDYILSPQRLRHILPHQMARLTEDELLQKYDSYFPVDIKCFDDLLRIAGMTRESLDDVRFVDESSVVVENFDRDLAEAYPVEPQAEEGLRVLLLDLSQYFSHDTDRMLYDVVEAPLGLMYLLTYLQQEFGDKVKGTIAKSRIDFSDYNGLRQLIDQFDPQVIGIRTLTFYSDFFHKSVALIRQWGFDGVLVAGGPYATSDYPVVLQDHHVDVVVMGEGEITFSHLIEEIIANNGKLPSEDCLRGIPGLAFLNRHETCSPERRDILFTDALFPDFFDSGEIDALSGSRPEDLAYVIYTSGSTGRPKGVMITHDNVVRLLKNQRSGFSFGHDDTWTMFHSYNFDFSVWEIFGPLLHGGKLVIVPKVVARDTRSFAVMLASHRVTVLNQTPAAFYNLADEALLNDIPLRLRYVIFGGDALAPGRLREWKARYPGSRLINMYGITETTVHVTFKEICSCDIEADVSNIGKPIPTTTLYVMDPDLKLVPTGGEGELVVGGLGLGRGYLNRPELTSQRFVEHPYFPGRRLYRSGDLGRLLEGGDVLYSGRMDRQVQVRGFRVELPEIEHQLRRLEGITSAVVINRAGSDGDTLLIGYVVGERELDTADIRDRLAAYLPDYMIPSFIVHLSRFPLTKNGKVDYSALPEPLEAATPAYQENLTPVQEILINLWAGILELDKASIGLDANFFDLGGHSLKATKLLLQIQRELNVKVPLVEIFDKFSIRELALYIQLYNEHEYNHIPAAPPQLFYETSSAQKRLFALQALDPHCTAYNIPVALALRGEVENIKLEDTFRKLIHRHESFRTSFSFHDGRLIQKIHPHVPFALEVQKEPDGEPEQWIRQFISPFCLESPPLLRVLLVSRGPGLSLMMADLHHIIADGISIDIMVRDFMALYNGDSLSEPQLQYKDYCHWQHGAPMQQDIQRQKEYWLAEFAGETPVIDLPTDYQRPRLQDFAGASLELTLDQHVTESLRELAESTGTTLYMILLTLFYVWLYRLTGQEELVVGTPVAGRRHPDLEMVIGMFVNTLPLKHYPHSGKTLGSFIHEIKERTLEAFENQEYPLEDLAEAVGRGRDASRNPLFDVMFVLQNIDIRTFRLPRLEVEPLELSIDSAKFDVILRCIESRNTLICSFNYNTNLFKRETIRRFAEYFATLCRHASAGIERRLGELPVLRDDEKQMLLEEFNDTRVITLPKRGLYDLFLRHCVKTPDHTAVAHQDCVLTYDGLDNRARALGDLLRRHGVKRDTIVGLWIESSNHLALAALAVIAAGAGFLPLDRRFPAKRMEALLVDCNSPILLTGGDELPFTNFDGLVVDISEDNSYVDGGSGYVEVPREEGLAYMISTSGTTGKPKGVLVNRQSLVNYIIWFSSAADISGDDRTTLLSSFAFDLGYTSVFGSLANGGQLHFPDQDAVLIPEQLLEFLSQRRISFVKLTPSLFATLVHAPEFNGASLHNLRLVVLGGEEIDTDDVAVLHREFPDIRVMNHYGPAESCIGAIARFVDFNNFEGYCEIPTIGSPIHNIQAYVLDSFMQPIPIGVRGELYLGGAGLARGYLNDPEGTAERFTSSPWDPELRIYRTGDMARWRENGTIEFLGRIDQQVKIRGFRVECGEVGLYLKRFAGISDAVVLDHRDATDNIYLCAYYVADEEFSALELRHFMETLIPDYMIPSFFYRIDTIPLNKNGKLDRLALPAQEHIHGLALGEYEQPRDAVESMLARVWEQVLGQRRVGIQCNFFSIGGDSIKAIQIVSRVREAGYEVKIRDIFQYSSIAQLAPRVSRATRIPQQSPVMGRAPLTPIQRRFFHLHTVAPHHYNQSVVLEAVEGFSPAAVQAALTKIIEHHDGLRMTFFPSGNGMVQENQPIGPPIEVPVIDCRELEDSHDIIQVKAQEIQESIVLNSGPLVKAAIFQLRDCTRLLLVIHHLVVDTVSWRIIIEDFHTLYTQALDDGALLLPSKSDSFKVWADALWDGVHTIDFSKEKEYWQAVEAENVDEVPVDFPDGDNLFKDADSVSFSLDYRQTTLLEKDVQIPFKTTMNDILLTALGLALGDTFGISRTVVSLEGHGREEVLPDLDISRTTGWFTSVFPVILEIRWNELGRQIKEIKERLHRVPRKGIGYGILRYTTASEENSDITFQLAPGISFNYLGRFAAPSLQPKFRVVDESAGVTVSPMEQRVHDLDVVAAIREGCLHVTVIYGGNRFRRETVQRLADGFLDRLQELISFCNSTSRREPSPSDFTYRDLSIDQVDQLNRQYGIQDIYRLTPMQEGMLFHALYDRSSAAYFRQTSFRIDGELDAGIVELSLLDLVSRYEILRTAFVHEGMTVPLQVVLQESRVDFYVEDLQLSPTKKERQEAINRYKEEDRRRKFDLACGYLLRVAMFRLGKRECVFVWSHHHILMDGWCSGMLIGDFFEIVNCHAQGRELNLPPAPPYRSYLRWLEKQNSSRSMAYWKTYMDGFERVIVVPGSRTTPNSEEAYQALQVVRRISSEDMSRLNNLAVGLQVTLSTVLQVCWAMLLGKYNGTGDVAFGLVVSGRPGEIHNVETMIGLFINTIPVRISFDKDTRFNDLAYRAQQQAIDSEPHHYCSLADIQSQLSLKQKLFDHIFQFGNYPVSRQIASIFRADGNDSGPFAISDVEAFEQNNYPFALVANGMDDLSIEFKFDARRFDPTLVGRMADNLKDLLLQVIENPHRTIDQFGIKHWLLAAETEESEPEQGDFCFEKLKNR